MPSTAFMETIDQFHPEVGGHRYHFQWKAKDDMEEDVRGYIDYEKLIIALRVDLPNTVMAECILHELLHAIYSERFGHLKEPQVEESVVTQISSGLFTFCTRAENRGLLAFLVEAAR